VCGWGGTYRIGIGTGKVSSFKLLLTFIVVIEQRYSKSQGKQPLRSRAVSNDTFVVEK
jgi:hypothetical protein